MLNLRREKKIWIYSFHQNEKKIHSGFYILIAKSISWHNCIVNYRPVIKSGGNTIIGTRELEGPRGVATNHEETRGGAREKCGRRSAHIGSREKSQSVTGSVFSGVVNDWIEPLVLKNELAGLRWQAAARVSVCYQSCDCRTRWQSLGKVWRLRSEYIIRLMSRKLIIS